MSLGSNLGDRRAHLERGLRVLAERVRIEAVSRVVESEPWGPVPQGRFLNLVARGSTATGPRGLLEVARVAEASEGRGDRVRSHEVRYGPRTLDVDVLFFGNLVVEERGLTIPHPHWTERPFVFGLVGDVAGELIEPRSGLPLREIAPAGPLPEGLEEVEPLGFPVDRAVHGDEERIGERLGGDRVEGG